MRRLLLIRLDEIGDAVLTTPVVRALHDAFPSASITMVVKPAVAPLFEACPFVDRVVPFEQGGRRGVRPLALPARAWRLAARELRPERPDVAILPRWDVDAHFATLLAWFSGAPRRIGHSSRVTRRKARLNAGFDALLTDVIPPGPLRPMIDHHLEVLRPLGIENADPTPALWTTPADDAAAERWLAQHPGGVDGRIIAVGPSGGNSALKQWPLDRYVSLVQRLAARLGVRVVVVGGPGEEHLGRVLQAAAPGRTLDLVGKTTVRELIAVLRQCALFVGNDAGPLHLAAGAGIPTLGIFGSSDVERFRPRGTQHRVLWHALPCSPVYHPSRPDRCRSCIHEELRCLLAISVDEVEQHVAAVVKRTAASL